MGKLRFARHTHSLTTTGDTPTIVLKEVHMTLPKDITERMTNAGINQGKIAAVVSLIEMLECLGVKGINQFASKLMASVSDTQQIDDLMTEGHAACLFASAGLETRFYPPSAEHVDVDLVVSWRDHCLFVEVSRFREDEATTEKIRSYKETGRLAPYGRGDKDVELVYGKTLEEARQLPKNQMGMVFLLSDSDRIEDIEFCYATEYLGELVTHERSTYSQLSAVLFHCRSHTARILWCNPVARHPLPGELAKKLSAL
jgi:hypothetical protein